MTSLQRFYIGAVIEAESCFVRVAAWDNDQVAAELDWLLTPNGPPPTLNGTGVKKDLFFSIKLYSFIGHIKSGKVF